jgi:hypothetical protein
MPHIDYVTKTYHSPLNILIPPAVSTHTRLKTTLYAKSKHAAVTFMQYSQTFVSIAQTRLTLYCNPKLINHCTVNPYLGVEVSSMHS